MKRLVIKGGHLIDPSAGIVGFYDIYVSDGPVEYIR